MTEPIVCRRPHPFGLIYRLTSHQPDNPKVPLDKCPWCDWMFLLKPDDPKRPDPWTDWVSWRVVREREMRETNCARGDIAIAPES